MKIVKQLLALSMLMVVCNVAEAQTFTYHYDASGNRIKREVSLPTSTQNVEAPLTAQAMVSEVQTSNEVVPAEQQNQDAFKLLLYPNPTTGVFSLELPELKPDETGSLLIYNIVGNMVVQQNVVRSLQTFNIGYAMPGYYVVRVTIGEHVVSKTLIKQ